MPNKIRDLLGIIVDVNLRKKAGKEYLEIAVEPHPNPISYRGEYFRRSGSTNQALKGSALDTFLLRKHGRRWDAVPLPGFHRKDCSRPAFRLFRTRAARSGRMTGEVLRDSDPTLLENLGLTEGMYLRRAAALLFSDEPDKFVSGAYIKLGFFVTDDDLRYQDEVHGSLFRQVDQAIELLKLKYLKAYIRYEGVQRIEEFLFPELALREAILNAVVHKDYSSGIPIQISIYDDKVVIWNSGQLPEDWTLERLHEKHPSVPYNPLLANAFFRAGYIEAWGRGIEKIDRECRMSTTAVEKNIEYLKFHGHVKRHGPRKGGGWEVASPLADVTGSVEGARVGVTGGDRVGIKGRDKKVRIKVGIKVGIKRRGKVGEGLTANQQRILELLVQQPQMTAPELAEIIKISPRKIEQNIATLKEMGRLRRIGSRKTGYWEVVK